MVGLTSMGVKFGCILYIGMACILRNSNFQLVGFAVKLHSFNLVLSKFKPWEDPDSMVHMQIGLVLLILTKLGFASVATLGSRVHYLHSLLTLISAI